MADSEGFREDNHLVVGGNTSTTSFSQLLFSNDDHDDVVGLDMGHAFHCPSSTGKPPKMLCFGGYQNIQGEIGLFSRTEATKMSQMTTPQLSGLTGSTGSSSASSGNNNNKNVNINTTISSSNRKRNGSGQVPMLCTSINTLPRSPVPNHRTSKKTKTENSKLSGGHAKVRREKLGDRITALQQLVSPFGKTDTASVLHEAMGYIRFLHDQVQVLCSPYLQHLPGSVENGGGGEESAKDLRSRGLCLLPVECTVHVASSNGADYWSPATGSNNIFSSSSSSSSNKQRM